MSGQGFRAGERVGDLEVVREIGRGAFGTVYLARDRLIGRDVALKVFKAPATQIDAAERERLLSEVRLIGRISSPHVVTLYRVHALDDSALMFEMEYVRGGSFEDLLAADAAPPLPRALEILHDVALGLRAAHEAGIVHGDVKPANVLLDEQGAAKLADFGLGRLLHDPGLATTTGSPVGTPRFMAPEVVMGQRATRAADVWSFGVMLHRVLAGQLPFESHNLYSLFFAIQNLPAPALGRDAPPQLARLAEQCLAKQPDQRPRDLATIARTLEGVSAAPDWRAAAPGPAETESPALFGREDALGRLERLLASVEAGEGRGVLVTGDAGIGKTTLLRAAGTGWRRRGHTWIETQVSPLRGLLQPLFESLQAHASGSSVPLAADSREQLLWKIERLLEGIANDGPVAVVVEDAHHAEAEDLRLLTGLAERIKAMPVLLAVAYRLFDPTDGSGSQEASGRYHLLVSDAQLEHIGLEGLPPEVMLDVLKEAAGGLELASNVAAEITRAAAGNPLFATEMLRHLREQGAVRERDGQLAAGPAWGRRALPRRIRDLVTVRLAGLPSAQREILDVAAVDGFEFDGEAVAAVLDLPLLKVLRALQVIYRERGLIAARDRGYVFAHPLLHEVIYEETAPELRRAIHRDLAEHLEARGDDVDPERVGTHWERAGDLARARPHLLRAAIAAEKRQEPRRALDLGMRAGVDPAALDEEIARAEPEACLSLAVCLTEFGRFDEADRAFGVLARAHSAPGDEEFRWNVVATRGKTLYYAKGVSAIDEPELRRAAVLLPQCQERGKALYCLGLAAKSRAEYDVAHDWFTKAEAEFRALGDDGKRSDAVDFLATLAKERGHVEEAEKRYVEAAHLSERVGRRINAAISNVNGDLLAFQRGALEGRAASLRRSIAALELGGNSNAAAHATLVLAHVLFAEGQVESAMELVRRARHKSEEGGFVVGRLFSALAEAQLSVVSGGLDSAEGALEEAEKIAETLGSANVSQFVDPIRIQVLVFRGERPAALGLARDALRRAQKVSPMAAEEATAAVAEIVPAGLPCEALDEAKLSPESSARLRCLAAGARAWERGDGADELDAAAEILLGPGIGERRAARRIVGHWLRAEAQRRRGTEADARREADRALEAARNLGHVWYQRLLEEWYARLA